MENKLLFISYLFRKENKIQDLLVVELYQYIFWKLTFQILCLINVFVCTIGCLFCLMLSLLPLVMSQRTVWRLLD